MLVDARDVYSQHNFDLGKTRQKLDVALKPKLELKEQLRCKVPLHLTEKLEKFFSQPKDADIIRQMGDDDEMDLLVLSRLS